MNIHGRSPAELPGGVPTIGIWGEWNTAGSVYDLRGDTNAQIGPNPEDNYYFATKSHTEVATSPEAFALMYEFFTGQPPATTDVVPEPPGRVSVSGRAVIFPENIGFTGTAMEVWRVDSRTGQRIAARPRVTYAIDETGDFGPVKLNGTKHSPGLPDRSRCRDPGLRRCIGDHFGNGHSPGVRERHRAERARLAFYHGPDQHPVPGRQPGRRELHGPAVGWRVP